MIDEFDLLDSLKKPLDELSFEREGLAEKSTSKQRAYIYSLCDQVGIDVESLKYDMKDLSKGEASELIEELEFERDLNTRVERGFDSLSKWARILDRL